MIESHNPASAQEGIGELELRPHSFRAYADSRFPSRNGSAQRRKMKSTVFRNISNRFKIYPLLASLVILAAAECAADVPAEPPRVDARGTRYFGKEVLHLGEIRLETNEWSDTNQTTCIFLDHDGTFGIEWKRGSTGHGKGDNPPPPNYPKAEIGIAPWNPKGEPMKSTSAILPIQLKDLKSASMTLDVTTTTTTNNGWNLAFELWLSDKDPRTEKTGPKAELMVFLGNQPKYWPWEPKGGTLNDGHNTYTLYETSDEWSNLGILPPMAPR